MLVYVISILTSYLIAVLLKASIISFTDHILELNKGFSNGGMPSLHTALISSLSAALLINRGFDELFLLSLVLTIIIASDAIKVRYNLGLQAEKLNSLLKKNDKIPVVRGHKLSQVLAGALIGISSSIVVSIIL